MESKTQLDYRFAWRWLLPIRAEDQIMLRGFTEHEVAFWKEILGHDAVTEAEEKVTVLVVNNLLPDCIAGYSFKCLRSFCIIGSNSIVTVWRKWRAVHFLTVNNYALLNPSNPRVVVPLGVNDWVVKSLALHRPGRRLARIILSILKGLVRAGFDWPLRTRMLFIANKDANALPQGAVKSVIDMERPDAPRDFALYLGTPDDNRKTVALPLGGKHQSILKMGDSSKARVALCNEAIALKAMSQTTLSVHVPELIDFIEKEYSVSMLQEYRPRQRIAKGVLKHAVVDFIIELSQLSRCKNSLVDIVTRSRFMTGLEAKAAGKATYAKIRDRLDVLGNSGITLWFHRCHGDFAPWNCTWSHLGLFVFDWEESKEKELAFSDAFYYITSQELYLKNKPNAKKAVAAALNFAMEVDCDDEVDVRLYLAIWLMLRNDLSPFYNEMLEVLEENWH